MTGGVNLVVEDVVVCGPPWRTRVAVRAAHVCTHASDGKDAYADCPVVFLELRWGRLVAWEDFEDTPARSRRRRASTARRTGSPEPSHAPIEKHRRPTSTRAAHSAVLGRTATTFADRWPAARSY